MIFENDYHRRDQRKVASLLSKWFRVEPTPTLCAYDFTLYRGRMPYAIVEYKGRQKLFDPLYVDCQKVASLVNAARCRKVKPIFIVGRGPYYWCSPHLHYPVTMFRRTKDAEVRMERHDEVFEIPRKDFSVLRG